MKLKALKAREAALVAAKLHSLEKMSVQRSTAMEKMHAANKLRSKAMATTGSMVNAAGKP